MTKITAIIQGPVTSNGRTFQTSGIGEAKKSANESDLIVNFDSSSTILENVRRLREHGVQVIYSGWIGDCSSALKGEIERAGAKVILSDGNNAPSFVEKNSPFGGVLSINNKSKQFYSILKGLELIDNLSEHTVIKIRSDILFNLDQLLLEIKRSEKQIFNGALILQYLKSDDSLRESSGEPDLWIPDFLFVGRGDVLHYIAKDLVNRSLSDKSYNDSPHVDLGNAILRYHWSFFPTLKKRDEPLKALIKKFKFLSVIQELLGRCAKYILGRKMVSLYQNGQLIAAPKEIQRSIVWRGDTFGENLRSHPEIEKGFIYGNHN